MRVNNFADTKNGLEGSQEDIVMGIAADNHLTLLNSLTNLYSNPVMAAFREYVANASDAHKDSGQTKPFEVTFPHRHESQSCLRIRDYGNGMTKDQITKVYSQYGASTKAKSNTQVGGFGLGSKSGLAVSNHLFVNTVANGILIKAKILKNKDNNSVIRILSEEPTKLPSGTEIILPLTTKQLDELRTRAEDDLVGYKPEQVTLHGSPITYTVHDPKLFIPIELGSNVVAYVACNDTKSRNLYGNARVFDGTFRTAFSIIMGGVYYPTLPTAGSVGIDTNPEFKKLMEDLNRRFLNNPKVILNVPVGSVDLPPHRDAIIDTEKTWTSLTGILMNLRMGLDISVQAYLNKLPLAEASKTVAAMQNLCAPAETWTHKGTTYRNDIAKVMSSAPILYSHVSAYYSSSTVRIVGKVDARQFTALHTRSNDPDYLYNNGREKATIVVVHLPIIQEKYDELVTYEANGRAHYSVRVKMNKPRLSTFINSHLKPVIEAKHAAKQFYVVVTPENDSTIPAHFAGAIDVTLTEAEIRAEYRKLFPPQPKKIVQQAHCRLSRGKKEYSRVSDTERIVYFGGKNCYGTESFMGKSVFLPQVTSIKQVSNGTVKSNGNDSWVQAGLLDLLPAGTSLIAVGDTRSPNLFKKAFPDASPLGKVVMDYYENLDSQRKLAIQHAYSIFTLWGDGSNTLFTLLGGTGYSMENQSIELLFKEPALISVAHYLFGFKDTYVEGLVEWKKEFMTNLKGKELAGKTLLPIQSLLGTMNLQYANGEIKKNTAMTTNLNLRAEIELTTKDLAQFISKLTAK